MPMVAGAFRRRREGRGAARAIAVVDGADGTIDAAASMLEARPCVAS